MFSVISPLREQYEEVEKWLLSYKKIKYNLVIKENGVNGDHPHLNVLWDKSVKKRTDTLTRSLKTSIKKLMEITNDHNLVMSKAITSEIGILRYLTKESNHEELYNDGTYDLTKIPKRASKWNGIMHFIDAPLNIVDFCEENNIDFLKTVGPMSHDIDEQDRFKKFLGLISYRKKIAVHHLLRKSVEIHMGVLFLLGQHITREDHITYH